MVRRSLAEGGRRVPRGPLPELHRAGQGVSADDLANIERPSPPRSRPSPPNPRTRSTASERNSKSGDQGRPGKLGESIQADVQIHANCQYIKIDIKTVVVKRNEMPLSFDLDAYAAGNAPLAGLASVVDAKSEAKLEVFRRVTTRLVARDQPHHDDGHEEFEPFLFDNPDPEKNSHIDVAFRVIDKDVVDSPTPGWTSSSTRDRSGFSYGRVGDLRRRRRQVDPRRVGGVAPSTGEIRLDLKVKPDPAGGKSDRRHYFEGDFADQWVLSGHGKAVITLPMYFPTEDKPLGGDEADNDLIITINGPPNVDGAFGFDDGQVEPAWPWPRPIRNSNSRPTRSRSRRTSAGQVGLPGGDQRPDRR